MEQMMFDHPYEVAGLNPPREIIPGFLDNAVALLAAKEGTGKTFLATKIAAHVASGSHWVKPGNQKRTLDTEVKKGLVIYCAAEGVSYFARRVTTAFDRINEKAKDAPFLVLPRSFNLMAGLGGVPNPDILEFVEKVRQAEEQYKPFKTRLIVFDTLSRYMAAGDENSAKDASALLSGCEYIRRQFDCGILLLHHMRKDQGAVRGSSAITAGVDEVIVSKSYSEVLENSEVCWTTKEGGKRKDRSNAEIWVKYPPQPMSDGDMWKSRNEMGDDLDYEAHYWDDSDYDNEGGLIGEKKYLDTLVVDLIDEPKDPVSSSPLSDAAKKVLATIGKSQEPIGVRQIMRTVSMSQSKLYKIIDVLLTKELIERTDNKKYRTNTPQPPQPPQNNF